MTRQYKYHRAPKFFKIALSTLESHSSTEFNMPTDTDTPLMDSEWEFVSLDTSSITITLPQREHNPFRLGNTNHVASDIPIAAQIPMTVQIIHGKPAQTHYTIYHHKLIDSTICPFEGCSHKPDKLQVAYQYFPLSFLSSSIYPHT